MAEMTGIQENSSSRGLHLARQMKPPPDSLGGEFRDKFGIFTDSLKRTSRYDLFG
jgi:hypothetical protein